MKTWEMIKELTENPSKEFQIKNAKAVVGVNDGKLQWIKDNVDFVIGEVALYDLEWEEVRKPIGFVELLERISKEGDITVDFEDYMDEHNFKDANLGEVLLHLSKEFTGDCLAETLLKSKWYVKE
jgi:hypothetical protein